MSSFSFKAKHKQTGDIHDIQAFDNYFGRHRYGYQVIKGLVVNEDQFFAVFDEIQKDNSTN